MQAGGPAHEGTLDLECKVLAQLGHGLHFAIDEQATYHLLSDGTAVRGKLGHGPGGEIGLDEVPEARVLGRIHGVRNGEMPAGGVAEGLVVLEDAHHVRMTE